MTAVLKTKAEQKVAWFDGLTRPLTADETRELDKAMHAIYVREHRLARAERIEREWGQGVAREHDEMHADRIARILEDMHS